MNTLNPGNQELTKADLTHRGMSRRLAIRALAGLGVSTALVEPASAKAKVPAPTDGVPKVTKRPAKTFVFVRKSGEPSYRCAGRSTPVESATQWSPSRWGKPRPHVADRRAKPRVLTGVLVLQEGDELMIETRRSRQSTPVLAAKVTGGNLLVETIGIPKSKKQTLGAKYVKLRKVPATEVAPGYRDAYVYQHDRLRVSIINV